MKLSFAVVLLAFMSSSAAAAWNEMDVSAMSGWQTSPVGIHYRGCGIVYKERTWTASGVPWEEATKRALAGDYSGVTGKGNHYGPEGDAGRPAPATAPLPGAPLGALVGRIGTFVFLVGRHYTIPRDMSVDAPLEFAINDDLSGAGLYDNRGFVRITFRCPRF